MTLPKSLWLAPVLILLASRVDASPVQGHAAVQNRAFVDPTKPGFLQVRFQGRGGLASIGAITWSSEDQQVNLATRELTARMNIQDADGNKIVLRARS